MGKFRRDHEQIQAAQRRITASTVKIAFGTGGRDADDPTADITATARLTSSWPEAASTPPRPL